LIDKRSDDFYYSIEKLEAFDFFMKMKEIQNFQKMFPL
jgi:hypothetical protein